MKTVMRTIIKAKTATNSPTHPLLKVQRVIQRIPAESVENLQYVFLVFVDIVVAVGVFPFSLFPGAFSLLPLGLFLPFFLYVN